MSDELEALMAAAAEQGEEIGDDEVEIDLSEAVTFEPFEAKVPVEIVAAVVKQGPKSRYIETKVRVFEGEYEGRVLWVNLTLTGKGASFGFEYLGAFGAKSKDGELVTKDNPRISLKQLQGLRAFAACAPDPREEYKHKVVIGKITPYVSAAAEEAESLK